MCARTLCVSTICPKNVEFVPTPCYYIYEVRIMKKQDIVGLVKYHAENNEEAFRNQVYQIAKDFDIHGDSSTAQYLMELVSNASYYVPQTGTLNYRFLNRRTYINKALFLPEPIEDDFFGVLNALRSTRRIISKFLFYGEPGTGKTETAFQIGRLLEKTVYTVNFEELVDSRLGETAKNVTELFNELHRLPQDSSLVIFDEIDSLILDRVNSNDLREMGRVTSTFLREFDDLSTIVPIIATTNLFKHLDNAIVRRFDAIVSFDRYSKADRIEIAIRILTSELKNSVYAKSDTRLFEKMLKNLETVPLPGLMKQIIKSSIAFSDEGSSYDYLKRIYKRLYSEDQYYDSNFLKKIGYTVREIAIITGISKSSVSRKISEDNNE